MKIINKKILIAIFIFLIILLLSISIIIANNGNINDLNKNKEKIYYQIKYLDNQIIDISNVISNSDNNYYFNLEELMSRMEKIYNYWNSCILDLNQLDIDKEHLTDFGKILDNLTVSIKNQNKIESLENLIKLYSRLTIYAQNLDYDTNYTNILYAKYNLVNAYSFAEKSNWTLMHENILKSSDYLYNVVNSMDNNKYNQYNINQAYVALKELENLITIKDFDIFYIKYQIAMEKLQNI